MTENTNISCVSEKRGHEEVYGAEALYRAFLCDPQTQTYFAGKDLNENSAFLHSHGKKVMCALTNAAAHIDDIDGCMSKLSDKHAHELMVDPGNFDILAHHILTVLAMFLPQLLTCANHRSVDKFLSCVKNVLTSKYR